MDGGHVASSVLFESKNVNLRKSIGHCSALSLFIFVFFLSKSSSNTQLLLLIQTQTA